MENDVFVLLLGANAGAYALAATFAGEYGVPVALMDECVPSALARSAFVSDARVVPGIAYSGILLRALSDFYAAHAGKSLLLIPTTEAFARMLPDKREEIERMYLLPQKKVVKTEELPFVAAGILLAYVSREGSVLAHYGRVIARTEQGAPLAVRTESVPQGLTELIQEKTPSFTVYAVSEDGRLAPLSDGGTISPFCLFPTATDASVAEWMLSDYVPCIAPEMCEVKSAVFSLCSYARLLPYALPEEREVLCTLKGKRLFISLTALRGEKRNPFYRRALRRFCAEFLASKSKTD